jgi:hypothetical protein
MFSTRKRHVQREKLSIVIVRDHSTTAILLNHLVGTHPLMLGAAEAGDPVDGSRAPR